MPASKQTWNWKKILRWAGTLASLGLFVYLLARQNWPQLWQALSRLPVWAVGLAFSLYLSGQAANALRWWILLRSQKVTISYLQALQLIFAGAFASNFLPSTIGGDALRMLGLFQYTTQRVMAVASVLLDRILNVLAYVTVAPFALGVALPQDLTILGFFITLPGWLRRILDKLLEAFRLWRQQPAALIRAFGVSWLSIFVIFLALFTLARGLGIPVALHQVIGINVVTYFLTLLPISVNGYGVREIAITGLYIQVGATLEQAAALAIISRLMLMAETLPGALWAPRLLPADKPSSDVVL
ncbi:MAG TPA: lysylphosphatidylglycerol synthase transmembrane domain-containing protein [Anaerolineaceae bacterium]|nr:lysylphosphatidylglycerol synthase transmembrane domain-containing protein [Anaerolineaceae bacterium]